MALHALRFKFFSSLVKYNYVSRNAGSFFNILNREFVLKIGLFVERLLHIIAFYMECIADFVLQK